MDQIPNLMRAMSFYPSEEELENIINEVLFLNEYLTVISKIKLIGSLSTFFKLWKARNRDSTRRCAEIIY